MCNVIGWFDACLGVCVVAHRLSLMRRIILPGQKLYPEAINKMIALIIEQNYEIKETFGYEIPFNEMTEQSMIQYACANYGPHSVVRNMTNEEKVKFRFTLQDQRKWLSAEWATTPRAQ